MSRSIAMTRFVALIAMVACLSMTAQAADDTLTLACKGTKTPQRPYPTESEPVSMGIIVNFKARTITGLTPPTEKFPLTIQNFNDVAVQFSGSDAISSLIIYGTIDRVTGDVEATFMTQIMKTTSIEHYSLKCRPAQRMF